MIKVARIHPSVTEDQQETEAAERLVSKKTPVADIRKMDAEPSFVKMYIEDLARILGLQAGHQEILMYVAASVDYQGIVSLAIGRKARIAATIGCSVKSVDNAIGEYVKHGVLARIGRGEYELDPKLFAKGEWRNIRERRSSFKTTITYSATAGRKIVTTAV
jgi:hypothetical protein